MPETNLARCYLCGAEKPFPEMSPVGSPTIENYCDPAITVDWFCDSPCFQTFRNSEHLRQQVYQKHDAITREVKETLRAIDPADLEAMEHLPPGLRIEPSQRARFYELLECLDSAEGLQSAADQALLLNVYRNKREIPFCYGTSADTITIKDYQTLREDFARLENG